MKVIFIFVILNMFSRFLFSQETKYYLIFDQNRKFGIVDTLGNTLLNPEYAYLDIKKNLIMAQKEKYGVLDAHFNIIVPFEYDFLWIKKEGIIVEKNHKTGVLSPNNSIIIPVIYDNVYLLGNGFFGFKKDGFFGVMDSTGKVIIKPKYGNIYSAFYSKKKELLFVVEKNSKKGIMDVTGKFILAPSFNHIDDFYGNYSIVHINGKYGIIDRLGVVRIKPYYDKISLEGNIYITEKDGKYGALDNQRLKPVLELIYDKIKVYRSETGFVIMRNNKYGFVDLNGKIIIDLIYDGADNFSNGLAPVLKNGKWGIINEKNEIVVDYKLIGNVKAFKNGFAPFYPKDNSTAEHSWLYDKGLVGLIDRKGNIVLDPIYNDVFYLFGNKVEILIGKNTFLFDLKTKDKILKLRDLEVSL